MTVKCPKGHWYEPDASGAASGCPQCAAQTCDGPPISEDDVLAIMSLPQSHGKKPAEKDAATVHSPVTCLQRKKKVCPECSHEASFSFDHCPRCGAPLKIASVELH
jgi:hypothetical protein